MSNSVTETKAQRVERLKREKNPWEGLDEIRRFSREGFTSIPPEWIGTYFRWLGVYTRNITGCPLAGVDADEICDTSQLALEANQFFVGNGDFYNLPRKFKICITGCSVWCAYPEINDVGLTAIRRTSGADSEIGFS